LCRNGEECHRSGDFIGFFFFLIIRI